MRAASRSYRNSKTTDVDAYEYFLLCELKSHKALKNKYPKEFEDFQKLNTRIRKEIERIREENPKVGLGELLNVSSGNTILSSSEKKLYSKWTSIKANSPSGCQSI